MDWREFGWASDSQVILFIGRLHPQKGLDLLQQQIDRIVPRETNRRLLLVGTGPLEESLRKWSDKAGHDRVQIRSWQNEIGPLLKGASLLVLPSYYEGMPNVVLEAFIASLPVVCSDVEGSAELLRHDFQRQSFPVGQSSIMADRIEQLLDQPVQAKEIGQSNHRRALEQFTILSMVERYESIYCGLSECKSGA
jgi:glycosyltransferase involved in cell wall biosynthesis